ncbi:hypothetical protein [Candidatus Hakubella thermalkaliphila]|uniref:hypothetical protein n=1 Tax=Candidatus Hakubella thermalkaliphila TaxID=2754717 RepID=UPI00159363E7|nr:hypothetical protein [Candidatus Hakubella thermalkaliphila]
MSCQRVARSWRGSVLAYLSGRSTEYGEHIRMFNKYAKTEDFKRDMKDREERSKFYQSLSKERLQSITEFELGEIILRLWASQLWGNKEYLVQKLLADNTLDTIKEKLSDLLWGEDPIERRYEGFLRRVKGLGPASITELLSHVHPTEGGIWNDKARKALTFWDVIDV